MSRPTGEPGRPRPAAAFTLVELLIAATVTATVLAASWGWLWNCAALARAADARTQSATSAAFAARMLQGDLEVAAAVVAAPVAYPLDAVLCVEHRHPGAAAETVLVVWDPVREVLWRKAPGSYLAEAVQAFAVAYYDAAGLEVVPGAAGWPQKVRRVVCRVVVGEPPATCAATVDVALEAS